MFALCKNMTQLVDIVKAALRRRLPVERKKAWVFDLSLDLDVSEESVTNWLKGYNAPSAEALLKLFQHFGPEFHTEIVAEIGHVVALSTDAGIVAQGNRLAAVELGLAEITGIVNGLNAEIADPDIKLVKGEGAE